MVVALRDIEVDAAALGAVGRKMIYFWQLQVVSAGVRGTPPMAENVALLAEFFRRRDE